MRILYIVPYSPWPIKPRSYNLIPRLGRRHQIDLVCVARTAEDHERLQRLRPHCASIRTGTYGLAGALVRGVLSLPTRKPIRIAWVASRSMTCQVEAAIRTSRPDVIYVERWRALQYVPRDCSIPVVCDPLDSMTLYNSRLMRAGRLWERAVARIEYRKFQTYEPQLAESVDASVFCSQIDIDVVNALSQRAKLVKVVNGVDLDTFHAKTPGQELANTICFSGNFGYAPNRHAARYFLNDILPRVRAKIPEVKLLVAGNRAESFIRKVGAGIGGIQAQDFVPDLQPLLASATVAVAPILFGAGVSQKILEAFSVGTAVVATSLPCGDLPVCDGEHLFIADDPQKFADRVVTLLSDENVRKRLVASAQTLVREQYGWELVTAAMERLLFEAAGMLVPEPETAAAATMR